MMKHHAPDPVDVHVGRIMRLRRMDLGWSQAALASALGVTFQQIQKYERAHNRVSASRLHRAAKVMSLSVDDFFAGLDGLGVQPSPASAPNVEAQIDALAFIPGVAKVADAFQSMRPSMRRAIVRLVIEAAKER